MNIIKIVRRFTLRIKEVKANLIVIERFHLSFSLRFTLFLSFSSGVLRFILIVSTGRL